jgi:hypothetical protein
VRVRQSDLDAFIEAGSTPGTAGESLPATEVDEGSVTAWATFGAAMADATATLERADRIELLGALERLTQATQALADSLGGDAARQPPGESAESAPRVGSPRLGAVRDALRETTPPENDRAGLENGRRLTLVSGGGPDDCFSITPALSDPA